MHASTISFLATFSVITLLIILWASSDHKANLDTCMKSGQSFETCEFYLK